MCRDHVIQRTAYGLQISAYVSRGEFVPDSFMLAIIGERLKQADISPHGVILDGLPRMDVYINIVFESNLKRFYKHFCVCFVLFFIFSGMPKQAEAVIAWANTNRAFFVIDRIVMLNCSDQSCIERIR